MFSGVSYVQLVAFAFLFRALSTKTTPPQLKHVVLCSAHPPCSFGIVLWEILTCKKPFDDMPHASAFQIRNMVESGVRPPVPADCPDSYAALMRRCWDQDPDERPDFPAIVAAIRAWPTLKMPLDPA